MNKKTGNTIEPIRHSLELNENIPLHKTGWLIQKIGWGILYTALVLALLGLFGTGPLSHQQKQAGSHVVRYERFMRFESEEELTIQCNQVKDTITLTIPQRYIEYVDIVAIHPLPSRSIITHGQVMHYFPASGNGNIHCTLMAKKTGSITTTIMINNSPVTLSHLIYP